MDSVLPALGCLLSLGTLSHGISVVLLGCCVSLCSMQRHDLQLPSHSCCAVLMLSVLMPCCLCCAVAVRVVLVPVVLVLRWLSWLGAGGSVLGAGYVFCGEWLPASPSAVCLPPALALHASSPPARLNGAACVSLSTLGSLYRSIRAAAVSRPLASARRPGETDMTPVYAYGAGQGMCVGALSKVRRRTGQNRATP